MTVRVKVCGITNREDALHAAASGADALGFVFYSGSPRCVAPQTVAGICAALPPFVTRVGLFVNEAPERILAIAQECGLDVLQLHGDETPQGCLLPPYRVIKGVRPVAGDNPGQLAAYPVSALLVDAAVPGQFGGTGQRADWDAFAEVLSHFKSLLVIVPAEPATAAYPSALGLENILRVGARGHKRPGGHSRGGLQGTELFEFLLLLRRR